MLLGDIIARFDDEAVAMEALVGLSDLALLARVEGAAEAEGLSPGEFAAQAVQAFSTSARSVSKALGGRVIDAPLCSRSRSETSRRNGPKS